MGKNNFLSNKYTQGILIPLFLLFLGVIVELLSNHTGVTLPGWPLNLYILIGLVVYLILLNKLLSKSLRNTLSGIEYSVGAIGVYAILILLMGFIKQNDLQASDFVRETGFSHINRSWQLFLVSLYVLIVLGLVILKRIVRIKSYKDFAFLLNHLGIWIVIVTASLATGDLLRASMPIVENSVSNIVKINDTTFYNLPFWIRLKKFDITTYNPDVMFYEPYSHRILNKAGVDYSVAENKQLSMDGWKIRVNKVLENAKRIGDGFELSDSVTNEYAANITAKYGGGKIKRTFWISSGNYILPSTSYLLSKRLAITLSMPAEKKFLSVIDIIDGSKIIRDIKILVNKPYNYKGFNIYQAGYKFVDNSKISILEVVKDPWLSIVYVGLIMLVVGAVMLLWIGKIR